MDQDKDLRERIIATYRSLSHYEEFKFVDKSIFTWRDRNGKKRRTDKKPDDGRGKRQRVPPERVWDRPPRPPPPAGYVAPTTYSTNRTTGAGSRALATSNPADLPRAMSRISLSPAPPSMGMRPSVEDEFDD